MLSIRAEVDPSTDYRGFEVLVAGDIAGEPDTLGYAITDSTGSFSMQVRAPGRGVYRLIISRLGQIQASGQMAIAEGDSGFIGGGVPSTWKEFTYPVCRECISAGVSKYPYTARTGAG